MNASTSQAHGKHSANGSSETGRTHVPRAAYDFPGLYNSNYNPYGGDYNRGSFTRDMSGGHSSGGGTYSMEILGRSGKRAL